MPDLPFHTELVTTIIAICTTACFGLVLGGVLWQRYTRALPPIPLFPGSTFPNAFAYSYTAFFILTFSMASIQNVMEPEMETSLSAQILSCLIQVVLYAPLLIVYFSLPRRETPASSLWCKIGWVALSLFSIWFFSALLELSQFNKWLAAMTDCPPVQDVVERMLHGETSEKALMAVMAVFVAPITEECCFRGFVYNILKRWNGRWIATLASSLLFASVHASLLQFLPLTIVGIVLCMAYEKARSLWLPVVIHTSFNACSVLAILLLSEYIPV